MEENQRQCAACGKYSGADAQRCFWCGALMPRNESQRKNPGARFLAWLARSVFGLITFALGLAILLFVSSLLSRCS